jgi:hypothetical protein
MKTISLIAAWLFISLCLGWGVLKSAQKCVPLFTQGAVVKTAQK